MPLKTVLIVLAYLALVEIIGLVFLPATRRLFAGIDRARYFPPEDIWFIGHPLNYYYCGHLLGVYLGKLLGVEIFRLMFPDRDDRLEHDQSN